MKRFLYRLLGIRSLRTESERQMQHWEEERQMQEVREQLNRVRAHIGAIERRKYPREVAR